MSARLPELAARSVPDPWAALEAVVQAEMTPHEGRWSLQRFEHRQPLRLQAGVPARLRRVHDTPVAYTAWGSAQAPLVVCLGGVASTAMRFTFLAAALAGRHQVVCMDWLGRGRSGWLPHASEYGFETYVEQLRQLLRHLGGRPAILVGSSLGGSVALELAARQPASVAALVLNDVGPAIPRARRRRRAQSLDRFYVFRSPEELLRRVGASQKHDGPLSEARRLFLAWHQTRWSSADQGRVYRLDPRAMQAYQREAQHSVDQWDAWARVRAPVLLLHGALSDALTPPTIERMRRTHPLTLAHVPGAGHAPSLCDPVQIGCIERWLQDPPGLPAEFTLP